VSLNRAGRVRFRYKLESMDAGWQNAGSRRQAFYNLDYARSLPFAACVTVMECPPPILSPC